MAERNFLDDLADLKRRVRDLETSTRLPQFAEADDLDDGGYGGALILNNRENDITPTDSTIVALLISQFGWEIPAMTADFAKELDTVAVTSSSFVTCYGQSFYQAIADGYGLQCAWATDVGTTGELRVHNRVGGGDSTDAVALPANSAGFQTFAWLHGQPIGTSRFSPAIQARRTGGAGNVYVFSPIYGEQIGGRWISATSGGT